MDASLACATSGFMQRAACMLSRVEHRCARTAHEEAMVHGMRRDASSSHSIQPGAGGRLWDERCDRSAKRYDIMTFLDDAFVSTFRMHVDAGEDAILPSLAEFGDVLRPILRAGCVVIDLTQIAANPDYARKFPELPYVTIRAAWLAAQHFDADAVISTCLGEHRAFFARVFGFQMLGPARAAAPLGRTIACMALDYQGKKQDVETRYPFFVSTQAERLSIFGPVGSAKDKWRR